MSTLEAINRFVFLYVPEFDRGRAYTMMLLIVEMATTRHVLAQLTGMVEP